MVRKRTFDRTFALPVLGADMEVLQTLINGTLTGAVYGVVALSFVVIYRASKIVNLAQGQVIMVSAFFVWFFVHKMERPLWAGLP